MSDPIRRLRLTLLALLALVLGPSTALAQGSTVYQTGTAAASHVAKFLTQGRIADGGGALGDATGYGLSPFAITDKGGVGLCSHNNTTLGVYTSVCIGHDSSGPVISTNTPSLKLDLNGTPFTLPGSASCLGCGSMMGQNSDAVAITGGSMNNMVLGNTPSTTSDTGALHSGGGIGLMGQLNVGKVPGDFNLTTGWYSVAFAPAVLPSSGSNFINSDSVQGALFATHTSHTGGYGFGSESVASACLNDWPSAAETCWAGYFEVVHKATGAHTSENIGIEIDTAEKTCFNGSAGSPGAPCIGIPTFPSTSTGTQGMTSNLWVASGAGGSSAGVDYNTTAAMTILSNGAQFRSGIVVKCASLYSATVVGSLCGDSPGNTEAISMFNGMSLNWYAFGGTTPMAQLTSAIPASGQQTTLGINSGYLAINVPTVMTGTLALGSDKSFPAFGGVFFATAPNNGSALAAHVSGGGGSPDVFVGAGPAGTGHLRVAGGAGDSAIWSDNLFGLADSTRLEFRPVPAGSVPGPPAAGRWDMYVDGNDANKLKVRASTGTIVILGTP